MEMKRLSGSSGAARGAVRYHRYRPGGTPAVTPTCSSPVPRDSYSLGGSHDRSG
jgi:hypothetical protein